MSTRNRWPLAPVRARIRADDPAAHAHHARAERRHWHVIRPASAETIAAEGDDEQKCRHNRNQDAVMMIATEITTSNAQYSVSRRRDSWCFRLNYFSTNCSSA
jgi:hypothetical protein